MTRLSLGGLCSCSALGCAIAAAGPEPSLATRSPVATPIDVAAVRAMSVVDGRRLLLVVGDDPLELWTLRVQPGGEGSTVQTRVPLRDPDGRIPWTLLHELAGPRVLTRFDVDVASLLEAPDGTLWMGDLLGPFVLHFDGDGRLLDPPWPLPRFGEPGQLRAPDNPLDERNGPLRLMRAVREHARAHRPEPGPGPAPIVSNHHLLLDDGDPLTVLASRASPPEGLAPASSEIFSPARLQADGFRVVPWTVNEPSRMRELLALGVDGIITDRPDLLYEQLVVFDRDGDGNPGDLLDVDGEVDRSRFDLQGHRGARGLRPENTLPAMEAALDAHASTLEFDVAVTRDGIPMLSHDPRIEPGRCRAVGEGPGRAPDAPLIGALTRAEIQAGYVCDETSGRPAQTHDRTLSPVSSAFAERHGLRDPYVMPTLAQVYAFVAAYAAYYRDGVGASHPEAPARARRADRVGFNVETKTNPLRPADTVDVATFARATAQVILAHGAAERSDVQSFDFRVPLLLHEEFPGLTTAWLFGDSPAVLGWDGANLEQPAWRAGLAWAYRDSQPARVAAAGGFSALALSADARHLVAALRRPLIGADADAVMIFVFDLEGREWVPVRHAHPLEDPADVVAGLWGTPDGSFLTLERGASTTTVFATSLTETNPARIKRLLARLPGAASPQALWVDDAGEVWHTTLTEGAVVSQPISTRARR